MCTLLTRHSVRSPPPESPTFPSRPCSLPYRARVRTAIRGNTIPSRGPAKNTQGLRCHTLLFRHHWPKQLAVHRALHINLRTCLFVCTSAQYMGVVMGAALTTARKVDTVSHVQPMTIAGLLLHSSRVESRHRSRTSENNKKLLHVIRSRHSPLSSLVRACPEQRK